MPIFPKNLICRRKWHKNGFFDQFFNFNKLFHTFMTFRPQENYTVGTRQKVLDTANSDLLELLGFKIWHAYGRTGHPTDNYIAREQVPLGELTPD